MNNNNNNGFFNSKTFRIFISVVFAFVLFLNASAINIRTSGTDTSSSQLYSATVDNVPVELKFDTDKYFVTSNTVNSASVYLASTNQVQLITQKSSNSRTFVLTADLTKLSTGTQQALIAIGGLPSSISAQISPTSASVTIENKVTENFTVTPIVDPKLLTKSYSIVKTSLSNDEVSVVSGQQTIKKIASIEAVLPSGTDLTSNYQGKVSLIAVDNNGQPVSAVLSPSAVTMTVEVRKTSTSSSSSSK